MRIAAPILAVALGAGLGPAAGSESVRDLLARSERRPVLPHELPQPPAGAGERPAAAGLLEQATGFVIEIDRLTGRPARAMGGSIPWLPGAGTPLPGPAPRGAERRALLLARAFAFVAAHPDLFQLEAAALVADPAGTVTLEEAELDVIRLGLRHGGLPVLGGGLTFVVRHGALVYFGSSHALAPPADAAARAAALPLAQPGAAAEAFSRVVAGLGLDPAQVSPVPPRRELFLLPAVEACGYHLRPVRAVGLRPAADPALAASDWEAWIDAESGERVALFPVDVGCGPGPDAPLGRVRGGVRPARADDPEETRLLPHADVGGGQFADRDGTYPSGGGPASSRLEGRHARIVCIACQNPDQALAMAGEDGAIDFGRNPFLVNDNRGNGTSTRAARTAFYHLAAARDLAVKWLGSSLGFLDQGVDVLVNAVNACNAFWSGTTVKFFLSSAECRNTGEIRDVIVHEWGHALDDFDGTGISDPALSEGASDVLAMLLSHRPCIAESLYLDPDPAPSAVCTGIRDLDELSPGLRHRPPVLTVSDNDCGGGSHCRGEIFGQAAFHLWYNLAKGKSYDTGATLGPALGDDVAFELLERLLLLSRPLAEALEPGAAGLSVYDAFLLVDRDAAGNHPHAASINEAFAHHQLAETPPVAAGAPCLAPGAPLLATPATVLDDRGEAAVLLSWSDTSAARYRLLRRRQGAEAAFQLRAEIGDDDRAGYAFTDVPVEDGVTYEYLVLPEGEAGCYGAATARAFVSVALPELVVAGHLESDPPPGGNGNGILEPGELFELAVELAEASGRAGAGDVVGRLTSGDPLVRVLGSGEAAFGDLAPLGRAFASAPFLLHLDATHPCQGGVPLILSLTSAGGGCRVRPLRVVLPPAACPSGELAELRLVDARLVDDRGDPDCSDGDGLLDGGEEGEIRVAVENLGGVAATAVEVLLSTAESRLAFLSSSRVQLAAPLAPGATAEASFRVLAGDLPCATSVPFLVEARAPECLAPTFGGFSIPTEEDLVAGALAWDFEADAQGWQASPPWQLSQERARPGGGWSFHSGAELNLCADLVSPPFRLTPGAPASLSLWAWYKLQPRFQSKYWDGVNVYLLDGAGEVLLEPSGGRPYDALLTSLVLCEGQRPAFAGDRNGTRWEESRFDLSPWAGETVRLRLRYGTDNRDTGEGFYLDDVRVEPVETRACDGRVCPPDPACSTPEMRLTATGQGCAGQPLQLVPSFDYFGRGSFLYDWDFGDGRSETAAVPDLPVWHAYATPGTYVARLTAQLLADPRCSSSATVVVTVTPPPSADAGPDLVDAPAQLGVAGAAGLDYRWEPALGLDDPRLAQPRADPTETTSYCLTVTDPSSGCSRSDCILARVPSPCGLPIDAVRELLLSGDSDVLASWQPTAGAGAYALYRLVDKRDIPAVEAWNTRGTLLSTSSQTWSLDPGGVSRAPALLFYQVVPRCP